MATVDVTATSSRSRPAERVRHHLRDPMRRASYSLIAGSAITSVLGIGFWIVAARLYDEAELGVASSLIATMIFLANAATLGLRNGLVRFLPTAGTRASGLVRGAYAACATAAAAAALVFLVVQPLWAPELDIVGESVATRVLFVAATVGWVLFVLQDNVLTGLRLATWVPVENAAYAVSKLVLLVAAVGMPTWGIFVSWSLPAIVLLVPVNVALFRALRSGRAGSGTSERHSVAAIVRFAAGDHAAAFLWLAVTDLLVLVVLSEAGPTASAYYFLAFVIAYALYLVTSNVSSAFVVEAASHPDREAELIGRAVSQAARLVVPAAVVGIAVAPWALMIVGEGYADQGANLLRLMLASAIPQVIVGLAIGRARAQRRIHLMVGINAAIAVMIFTATIVGLRRYGLDSVGWAWLGTQTVLALILAPTVLWPSRLRPAARALAAASWIRSSVRQTRRRLDARRLARRVLRAAGLDPSTPYVVLRSHNDVVVMRTTPDADVGVPLVLKVATSSAGAEGLTRHLNAIRALSEGDAAAVGMPVPEIITSGVVRRSPYVVESFVAGRAVDELDADDRAAVMAQAWAALNRLHVATGRPEMFDDEKVRRLIDEPVERLAAVPALAGRRAELDELREWLADSLVGRVARFSSAHGDFWPGNVLAEMSSGEYRLTAIVDWENGTTSGLGAMDRAHLWLAEQPGEFGQVVVDALTRPEDSPAMSPTDDETAVGATRRPLPAEAVLLLTWLGHVADGVGRGTQHRPSRIWLSRNVTPVLDQFASLTRVASPQEGSAGSLVRGAEGERRAVGRRADRRSVAAVGAAVALWVAALWGADPAAMGETGLITLLGPASALGLAALVVGFVLAVRRDAPGWVLALHVVAFIGLIHGTPAVLYETLRYSWAWKHVGIVDYISRTRSVDTTVAVTPIYHGWPGFFAASALLTELVGARNAIRIATWAPLAFNLLNLLGLRFLLRSFTDDRRWVWSATGLFFITSWVGQDYFSPQAFAFFLYLVLMGTLVRGCRRHGLSGDALARPGALVVAGLLMAAVVVSHQITPMMALSGLILLVITRRIRGWYLPVLAGLATLGWASTVGRGILLENVRSLVASLGRPLANAEETLDKTAYLAPSQQIVSLGGRLVVLGLALVAFAGVVRLRRSRRLDPSLLVLAAAPAALPLVTEFGGEVVFRVFLFAAPILSLLAAAALLGAPGDGDGDASSRRARNLIRPVVAVVVSGALLAGFAVAYYGKDQQYYFTPAEVEAARWVGAVAPPDSLLVEGTPNYPARSLNYERFTYVPISREPEETWRDIIRDPTSRLADWLDNDDYAATYILITRSQKVSTDLVGPMPRGSLDRIEQALRASPDFRVVYDTGDGVVFQLAEPIGSPR